MMMIVILEAWNSLQY